MMQDLVREASKLGLEVNWSKTHALDMANGTTGEIFVSTAGGDRSVKIVEEIVFLGRAFTSGGGGDIAVERRVQKACKKL